jgi:hypothetical protein
MKYVCAGFLMFLPSTASTAATISVRFDQDEYIVQGPGEAIDAWVLIDGNLDPTTVDRLRAGLFSMGLAMSYPSAKAQLADASQVMVVPELSHFGFSAAPFVQVSPGFAGAKGNIDVTVDPQVDYVGSSLVKFTLTNTATGPDTYPLTLDFFRTVGPNEQLFLDGLGNVLDPEIQFGSARVIVVPEPLSTTLTTAMLALLALMWHTRRMTTFGHS